MKPIIVPGLASFLLLVASSLVNADGYDTPSDGRDWYKIPGTPNLYQGSNFIWSVDRVRDNCHGWVWRWNRLQPSPGPLRFTKDWRNNGIDYLSKKLEAAAYKDFTDSHDIITPASFAGGSYESGPNGTFVRGYQVKQQGFASNYYPGGTTQQFYTAIQPQVDELALANMNHQTAMALTELTNAAAARESYVLEKKIESQRQLGTLQLYNQTLQNQTVTQWEQGSIPNGGPPQAAYAPQAPNLPNYQASSFSSYSTQSGRGNLDPVQLGRTALATACSECHSGARPKGRINLDWRNLTALAQANPDDYRRLVDDIDQRTAPNASPDIRMPKGHPSLPAAVRDAALQALDTLLPQQNFQTQQQPAELPPEPLPPQPQSELPPVPMDQ